LVAAVAGIGGGSGTAAQVALEASARVSVWEMLLGMSGSRVSGGAGQEME
jgi:hypothetical protein